MNKSPVFLRSFIALIAFFSLFSLNLSAFAAEKPVLHVCIFDGGGFENGALIIKIDGESVEMAPSELPLYKQEYCTDLEKPTKMTIFGYGEEYFSVEYDETDLTSKNKFHIIVITKKIGAVSIQIDNTH